MTEFYPEGAFGHPTTPGQSAANDPNNSRPEDYAFSSYGDVDRSGDDEGSGPGAEGWEPTSEGEKGSTNTRSRANNAAAADTENNPPHYERAEGSEPSTFHEYGKS